MSGTVTQVVKGSGADHGDFFTVDGAPWIRVLPVRTPTLPPATRTNCYIVGEAGRALAIDPATPHADEQARLDEYVAREGIVLEVASTLRLFNGHAQLTAAILSGSLSTVLLRLSTRLRSSVDSLEEVTTVLAAVE